MKNNKAWINKQIRNNKDIVDIGPKLGNPTSDFYKMELDVIKKRNYNNINKIIEND